MNKACLDPVTGKILVLHYQIDDSHTIWLDGDEKHIVKTFWCIQSNSNLHRFVTHNGNDFDWWFIILRSFILGISVPMFPYNRFKTDNNYVDLAEVWNLGRIYSAKDCISLRHLCKIMNVPAGLKETHPEISENFEWNYFNNREQTLEYAADEVRVLRPLDLKLNKGVV